MSTSLLGTIAVKVTADLGPLRAGLTAAETEMQTASSKMDGVGAAFGKLASLGPMVGIGLLGVGAALGAVAVKAVQMDSQLEQDRIAFSTMLGSAQQADAFLKQLANFAASTPFELVGLKESAKQLLAFGFQAKDIIPTMTAVGDAVSALGGGQAAIDHVTMALGQMMAKGKVQSDEMLQLAESGIPAWDFLAKKLGTDIPGAMKKVQAGAVSASTGIAAITQGMEARFGGLMSKQSQTIAGIWSNLQDNVGQVLTQLGARIIDTFDLKSKLSGAMTILGQFRTALEQGKGPADMVKLALQDLGMNAGQIRGLTDGFNGFRSVLSTIGALAQQQFKPMTDFFGWLKANHPDILFAAVGGVMLGVVAALTVAFSLWAISVIAATWPLLLIIAAVALLAVGAYMIISNWGAISGFFVGLWNTVKAAFADAWSAITGFVGNVLGAIGAFFANLGTLASAAWSAFASNPIYWIGYLLAYVPVKLNQLLSQFTAWAAQHIAQLAVWAAQMAAQGLSAVGQFIGNIIGQLPSLPGRMASGLGAAISAVISWAGSLAGQGRSAASQFVSSVAGELGRLPGQVASIGAQVGQGIINGLRGMMGAAVRAAQDFINGMVAGAKAAAGIHSPSVVFHEEVGRPIAQGVASGVMSGLPEIVAAMQATVSPAPAQAASAASRGSLAGPDGAGVLRDMRDLLRQMVGHLDVIANDAPVGAMPMVRVTG